jgi:deoxycytidylate deaminase
MNSDDRQPQSLDYPELVIGMAGPIGVDLDLIARSLGSALTSVGYTSELIKLTAEMERYPIAPGALLDEVNSWKGTDTHDTYMRKMSAANALRKQYDDPALLARIAIDAIRARRGDAPNGGPEKVRAKHAYLIRQLKRPEEVSLLRKVYGRQFVLVSAYAPEARRRDRICDRLRGELSTSAKALEVAHLADRLIDRDASEDEDSMGQQLRETFHLADVFIDGLNKSVMDDTVSRFVDALFGRNDITPSKDEYGMYAAKSASLRSSDLSRQVGAAVFSAEGEIITQGCNGYQRHLAEHIGISNILITEISKRVMIPTNDISANCCATLLNG